MEFDPDSWPACWILEILARTGSAAEFYHNKLWKRKRREILRKQKYCWACAQKNPPKLVTQQDAVFHVHHRFPLRQRPDLALSEYTPGGVINLVAICDSCHWDMHHTRRIEITPERW